MMMPEIKHVPRESVRELHSGTGDTGAKDLSVLAWILLVFWVPYAIAIALPFFPLPLSALSEFILVYALFTSFTGLSLLVIMGYGYLAKHSAGKWRALYGVMALVPVLVTAFLWLMAWGLFSSDCLGAGC